MVFRTTLGLSSPKPCSLFTESFCSNMVSLCSNFDKYTVELVTGLTNHCSQENDKGKGKLPFPLKLRNFFKEFEENTQKREIKDQLLTGNYLLIHHRSFQYMTCYYFFSGS